jgi:hypothetical protein
MAHSWASRKKKHSHQPALKLHQPRLHQPKGELKMAANIGTLRALISEAKAAYLKAETRDNHLQVKSLQSQLSAAITEGAEACPKCGNAPVGIEHQTIKGAEYEVGCMSCPPFAHTDGTTRRPAARGGLLPKHTVEAWNAGPDYWVRVN